MKELVFLYIDHSLAGYRIYPEVPDGGNFIAEGEDADIWIHFLGIHKLYGFERLKEENITLKVRFLKTSFKVINSEWVKYE